MKNLAIVGLMFSLVLGQAAPARAAVGIYLMQNADTSMIGTILGVIGFGNS